MESVKFDKLESPKVKDLVAKLLTFDQEKEIRIEDPDTGWEIHIIHFGIAEDKGKIFMGGEYPEMGS